MGENTESLKILPLEDMHVAAGAKFGAFAGWRMPITYPPGVMKEHLHTREKAGLFDISHMKLILVAGEDAGNFLSYALPTDAAALKEGQSRYSFLLNDKAGILDDLIITRLGENRYMVAANAGNCDADIAELCHRKTGFDCTLTPLERVFLALQGPMAAEVMQTLGLPGNNLTFMHGCEPHENWFLTRSGYTGEDGFEIAVPVSDARNLAQKLLSHDAVEWIGLAARDSLRLEAGLCLHGQDISVDITPIDAGITWAVTKSVRERAAFFGAQAYLAACAQDVQRRRVGLAPQTRQPVRAGAELFDSQNNKIGIVTSGGFGPSFDGPVAMGYVVNNFSDPDTEIFADVRGKKIAVHIHALPFVQHRYFKG